jgi:hypothetical protein
MQMSDRREGRRVGRKHVDQRIAALLCDPARRQIIFLVKQLNTLQALRAEALERPRCHHLHGLARDPARSRLGPTPRPDRLPGNFLRRPRVRELPRAAHSHAGGRSARPGQGYEPLECVDRFPYRGRRREAA